MKLWIVGKNLEPESKEPMKWEFQGVFSEEEKAIGACGDHEDLFIAPAILDKPLPYETMMQWEGAYYPNLLK